MLHGNCLLCLHLLRLLLLRLLLLLSLLLSLMLGGLSGLLLSLLLGGRLLLGMSDCCGLLGIARRRGLLLLCHLLLLLHLLTEMRGQIYKGLAHILLQLCHLLGIYVPHLVGKIHACHSALLRKHLLLLLLPKQSGLPLLILLSHERRVHCVIRISI